MSILKNVPHSMRSVLTPPSRLTDENAGPPDLKKSPLMRRAKGWRRDDVLILSDARFGVERCIAKLPRYYKLNQLHWRLPP